MKLALTWNQKQSGYFFLQRWHP